MYKQSRKYPQQANFIQKAMKILLRTSPPAQRALPLPFKVMILARPDPFHERIFGMIVLIMFKLRALRRLGRLRINWRTPISFLAITSPYKQIKVNRSVSSTIICVSVYYLRFFSRSSCAVDLRHL